MKPLKKGDIVKCCMYYGNKKNPSQWTGKIAIILEQLGDKDFNPFCEDDGDKPFIGKITERQYNQNVAADVRYKASIEKEILILNHLCFVDRSGFLDWKASPKESNFAYL